MKLPGAALLVAFTFALICPVPASSSDITKKLDKLTADLVDSYQLKRPDKKDESLAVFDFTCSEKLAKQRIGFAVSQLLTEKLFKTRKFTVVERSAIGKVLDEQKLSLTGLVDPDTAVGVGKLVGAKILVMGSVEKLGKKYLVNARMVEVETGEIIAAAIQQLDAKLFEQEAQSYLNLVPDVQALGLVLRQQLRLQGKCKLSGAGPYAGTYNSITYETSLSPSQGANWYGDVTAIGLRFSPYPWLMLEGYYGLTAEHCRTAYETTAVGTGSSAPEGGRMDIHLRMAGGGLAANYVRNLAPKLRCFGGLGFAVYNVQNLEIGGGDYLFANDPDRFTVWWKTEWQGSKPVVPILQVGTEWKPATRFGISLWLVYRVIGAMEGYVDYEAGPDESNLIETQRHVIMEWEPAKLLTEVAVAFYF